MILSEVEGRIMKKLTVVATPIGNLGDISARAIEALKAADIIFCEDTRVTRKLLSVLKIPSKKLASARNERAIANSLSVQGSTLYRLENYNAVLVSDAGVPGVSDPGRMIVDAAYSAGFEVEVTPGPAALTAALSVSGLPGDRFVFEGFLPPKGSKRNKRLKQIAAEERTVILYESPHRIARTVQDLLRGSTSQRQIVIARELTKMHEEIWRGTLEEAVKFLESKPPRGEFTIVLASVD